ncbi:MAG: hypothetical protein Q9221_008676 [Calogaya cf. arnoldii]
MTPPVTPPPGESTTNAGISPGQEPMSQLTRQDNPVRERFSYLTNFKNSSIDDEALDQTLGALSTTQKDRDSQGIRQTTVDSAKSESNQIADTANAKVGEKRAADKSPEQHPQSKKERTMAESMKFLQDARDAPPAAELQATQMLHRL